MYQTLYRKYRPRNFDQVVGQNVIVKTLTNSIKNNRISHAYMFFGPRGVGKTSIAKIFARTVNCLNNDINICEKCDNCMVSASKECLDIIEIDAASNNGVDEIRELRDKINLVPSQLKYKVYIIDEVHMLTIQAFNALLKTLEEPPKHVIFILATTDPQKVPETIISRCQCFSFDRIGDADIISNLKTICEKEKIEAENEVLNRIASASNGGMRDSIGMLDKLYAYCENKITLKDFIDLNKLVSDEEISQLITFINNGDVLKLVDLIDDWNHNGVNIVQLSDSILSYLKEIIVSSFKNRSYDSNNIDRLIKLSCMINEKMFELKKSSNPRIFLEIMLLDFINNNCEIISREIISSTNKSNDLVTSSDKSDAIFVDDSSVDNVNKQEKNIDEKSDILNQTSNRIENSNIDEILKVRLNNTFAKADKNELNNDRKIFEKLKEYTFDQQIGYLVCALLDGNIRVSSKENLVLSYEYESVVEENLNHLNEMHEVLKKILNLDKKIVILSNDKWQEQKNIYIEKIKKNEKYQYKEEPKIRYNDKNKNKNKISNKDSLVDTFGDIVEIE